MLSQDDGTNELFYSQLGEIPGSVALILMGDFNFPDKSSGAGNPIVPQVKQAGQKTSLKQIKKIYDPWKQGVISQGEYSAAVHIFRGKKKKKKAPKKFYLS